MATNYVQEGKTLNYTAGADITSGQFVLIGTIGGVAKTDIVSGKTGAVHVCGVFSLPKASGAVTQGAKEIEGYLRSIGDVQFAGAMKEQAGTLNVALSNMGDAFSKLVKAIGDAGLTDILIFIADKIKWLAQLITDSIEPFRLGFKAFIAEVIKFGNHDAIQKLFNLPVNQLELVFKVTKVFTVLGGFRLLQYLNHFVRHALQRNRGRDLAEQILKVGFDVIPLYGFAIMLAVFRLAKVVWVFGASPLCPA